MKKNLLIAVLLVLVAGIASAEFLTAEQLVNGKKMLARLGIPGMTVDEVIDDYELMRYYAEQSYLQHKRIVLWLQDSGVTEEEMGDLLIIMQVPPTPTATP